MSLDPPRSHLARAVDLELEICLCANALGQFHLRRSRRLRQAGHAHRLAHLEDYRLAIAALQDAERAFSRADDAARRLGVLLQQERAEDARVWGDVARSVPSDEDRADLTDRTGK